MSTQTATTENLGDLGASEPDPIKVDLGPMAKLAQSGTIPPGTKWDMNGTWTISQNHDYVVIADKDGYFSLYEVVGDPPVDRSTSFIGRLLWSTRTAPAGDYIRYQDDGNVVVYKRAQPEDTPVWHTDTAKTYPSKLVVQDDGNLVLYKNEQVWASNTPHK